MEARAREALTEPSLDYDDSNAKSYLCVEKDGYRVILNQDALADLTWSLWWLAEDAPQGEDVSIWCGKPPGEAIGVRYCEITLVGNGRSHPGSRLLLEHQRLDLYVTRDAAQDAFLAVRALGFGKRDPKNATIFGNLRIELMDDGLWPPTARR